jgi:hypothetical protein
MYSKERAQNIWRFASEGPVKNAPAEGVAVKLFLFPGSKEQTQSGVAPKKLIILTPTSSNQANEINLRHSGNSFDDFVYARVFQKYSCCCETQSWDESLFIMLHQVSGRAFCVRTHIQIFITRL